LNPDCEHLVQAYGALQQCDANSQAEAKLAFESKIVEFAEKNRVTNIDKLRAFVQAKWFSVLATETKRRRITTATDPQ
jgi:hypothetical protein